mmetsp:Transcript_44561/g.141996  ORF Transcript_44561/g.141996 Transcript_44561/m.141996 type:complete len:447 (+) Transcript_44561:1601-2941(+)
MFELAEAGCPHTTSTSESVSKSSGPEGAGTASMLPEKRRVGGVLPSAMSDPELGRPARSGVPGTSAAVADGAAGLSNDRRIASCICSSSSGSSGAEKPVPRALQLSASLSLSPLLLLLLLLLQTSAGGAGVDTDADAGWPCDAVRGRFAGDGPSEADDATTTLLRLFATGAARPPKLALRSAAARAASRALTEGRCCPPSRRPLPFQTSGCIAPAPTSAADADEASSPASPRSEADGKLCRVAMRFASLFRGLTAKRSDDAAPPLKDPRLARRVGPLSWLDSDFPPGLPLPRTLRTIILRSLPSPMECFCNRKEDDEAEMLSQTRCKCILLSLLTWKSFSEPTGAVLAHCRKSCSSCKAFWDGAPAGSTSSKATAPPPKCPPPAIAPPSGASRSPNLRTICGMKFRPSVVSEIRSTGPLKPLSKPRPCLSRSMSLWLSNDLFDSHP